MQKICFNNHVFLFLICHFFRFNENIACNYSLFVDAFFTKSMNICFKSLACEWFRVWWNRINVNNKQNNVQRTPRASNTQWKKYYKQILLLKFDFDAVFDHDRKLWILFCANLFNLKIANVITLLIIFLLANILSECKYRQNTDLFKWFSLCQHITLTQVTKIVSL